MHSNFRERIVTVTKWIKKKLIGQERIGETSTFLLIVLFSFFLLSLPNIKAVVAAYLLLFVVYILHYRSVTTALLLSYIASWTVFTGKAFEIELIPQQLLRTPGNYSAFLIVSAQLLFGVTIVFEIVLNLSRYSARIRQHKSLVAFIAFLLLSSAFSRLPEVSLFMMINYLGIVGFFIVATDHGRREKKLAGLMVATLLGLGVFQSLVSLTQFVNRSPLGSTIEATQTSNTIQQAATDPLEFRSFGTFSHPNELSFFIFPILIYIMTLTLRNNPSQQEKVWVAIGGFLLGTTLLMTKTRATWVTLVALLVIIGGRISSRYGWKIHPWYLNLAKRIMVILLPALVFIGIPRLAETFGVFDPGGSAHTRIAQLREAVEVFDQKPVFGTGLGMSVLETFLTNPTGVVADAPSPPHMVYLHMIVEMGLLGFLAFMSFILIEVKRIIKYVREKTSAREKVRMFAYLLACIAILINGIFQPIMEATFKPLILFLVVAELRR